MLSVVLLAASWLSAAQAQNNEAEYQRGLEEIVVTGSLIRSGISDGSVMITSLGEADIERSGSLSAVEVLKLLPQNQPVDSSNTTIGASTGFASFANLRSLGSANTLVLFDGKRMVNSPFTTRAVDLNSIPFTLIERVETVVDGASSVYGSDAVAGVVNFIPKREFQGIEVSGTAQFPEASGGGEDFKGSAAFGYGDLERRGFNVYAGLSYRDQRGMSALDRDFSDTTFIPERGVNRLNNRPFPANYSQPETGISAVNPASPECDPPLTVYAGGQSGPDSCSFDFAPSIDNIVPQEDTAVLAHGVRRWGSNTLTGEVLWSRSELVSRIAPNNLAGFLSMTSVNPYFPGNGITPAALGLDPDTRILLDFGNAPAGKFETSVATESSRLLLDYEGKLGEADYSVWALRSESETSLAFSDGIVPVSAMQDALDGTNGAPFFNPFGEQTADAQAYIDENKLLGEVQNADGRLWMAGVKVSADVLSLPAGGVEAALAFDYRDEDISFRSNPAIAETRRTGIAADDNKSGERTAFSVTGELLIPVIEGLEFNPSVRYDDYDDFGSSTNPKILVTYSPRDLFSLHGSFSTGFRAPTLDNINRPTVITVSRSRLNDPVLCPGGVPDLAAGADPVRDCNAQYEIQTGGNADIGPEESEIFTAGLNINVTNDLILGIDYWTYRIEDTIDTLNETIILGDAGRFGSLIVRCSDVDPSIIDQLSTCADPTDNPIGFIDTRLQNLGESRTDGVDFTISYTSGETRYGTLAFDYRSTWVNEFKFQREPGGPFIDVTGKYDGATPAVFEYSHRLTFGWFRNRLSAQLSNTFTAGYEDCNAGCGIPEEFWQDVDDYSRWNFSLSFDVTEELGLTGRVSNLFDEDPPFTNKTQGLGTGWDERFTDPMGRAFSISATLRYGAE